MTAPARRTLFQDLTQVLKSGLFKTGLGAGAVRIAGLALMLAVSVVLARVLGANGLGQYALAISVINLLGLPALMGLPSLVTRETARALAVQDWPMMRGLWFWATGRILALSCVVIALCLLVLLLLPALIEDNARQVLLWGLPLVPLLALSAARSAALSGLGRVVWAQMPDNLFRPFVMIVLLSGAFILGGSDISAQLAMRLQVGAAAAAFAIGLVLFLKARPTEVTENTTRTQQTRDWNAAIWSIALIASAQSLMANADLLMLGWWRSAPEVGYYKVASTGASLCAIGMGIVASVINPRFAALHKTAETGKLARIASWGAAAGFAMASL